MQGAKERLKAEIDQFPLPYRQDITDALELATLQEEEERLLERLKTCHRGGGMPLPRRKIGPDERMDIFLQEWWKKLREQER